MSSAPQFSPFPFARLRTLTRRGAAIESALARWLPRGRLGGKLAALVGGSVAARLVGVEEERGAAGESAMDPHAALAEVRHAGARFVIAGSSRPVRALAQRLLGGAAELDAPRPLTVVEQAIWALAVSAALVDLGVPGEVWPLTGERGAGLTATFELALPAGPMTVWLRAAPDLLLRAPPIRPPHPWSLALPIVVGRCALPRASASELRPRDVITIEPCCELVIGGGVIGLAAAPGAVEARVATEYVARDMALPDDATFELTVQLGTTRLSLRQLGELAVGQLVPLGRPLAGPYEVRAAGRLVGQGELVDIDGELGVRIVSIADQPEE